MPSTPYKIAIARAQELLKRIETCHVAFIGDMCLDAYWKADMRKSVLSSETPQHPLPVVEERYSPGGGANVAANLAALRVGTLKVCSVLGDDWRGMLLFKELEKLGIDSKNIFTARGRVTTAYCKPMRHGISDVVHENARIDFENHAPLGKEAEEYMLKAIEGLAGKVAAVAVTEQCLFSVMTDAVREALCRVAEHIPVVVDSRYAANRYRHAIVKPNEYEAAKMFSVQTDHFDACAEAVRLISEKTAAPALLTLGKTGSLAFENGTVYHAVPFFCEPPLDIVGAGDTFLSAVTAALAAGATLYEAASLGNAASAVTIRKIGTTGTASPDEVLEVLREETACIPS